MAPRDSRGEGRRPSLSRRAAAVVFVPLAGAVLLFGFTSQPQSHGAVEFLALAVAAIVTSAGAARRFDCEDPAAMPASFVFDFATLLLLGSRSAILVATAGSLVPLVASRRPRPGRILLSAGATIAATGNAGLAYPVAAAPFKDLALLWQAVPIAAVVFLYCVVRILAADFVAPLVMRRAVRPLGAARLLAVFPNYVVGAGVGSGLAAAIDSQAWQLLAASAIPACFAFHAYSDYLNRIGDDDRRREVLDSLAEGMCVLDGHGRVTHWNDALERIVGCPRARTLDRPLASAVPALAGTDLQRAIDEALALRGSRAVTFQLPSSAGARILQIHVQPVVDGVTLLWRDVTARTSAERELRRSEERLALAAEGANDGLWEWDLRTREFYCSGRWRAMIGLPAAPVICRPEEWTDRVHPDDAGPLKEALDAHLAGTTDCLQHEHRIRHEDGTYRWYLCRGVAVRGAGRRPARIAGSLTDTTERVMALQRLRSAGFVDPLTGLCNRAVFVEGLGRRLEQLKQRRLGGWFAVLYLDLDRFKVVNDSLGHLVGDELLVAVSRRLESCLRSGDVLARLGGDEFAILLDRLGDEQQANAIAFRIQEALSAPFSIGSREVFTSASIGIAYGVAQYETPDEIMRDADTAMYHAKSRGKARHELFDADMHARARNRLGLENDLRRAVNNNDFEVHYQPIVLLSSGACIGFESLVRWTRNGEPVSPATFVPIAEELGLIEPLGTWVLQQACRTFADWQRRFPGLGLEYITVNASSRQLLQQSFLRVIEEAVTTARLKPAALRIEITETALMDSPSLVADVLRELRDFGVKIYLDDFGTGYSSLSHLHKLPVDALKIDHSFVRSLLLPDRPAIVESILGLARTLNTGVVAEGIESEMQARELQRLGCRYAQGFLYSRPLSLRAAEEVLVAGQPLGPACLQDADDESEAEEAAAAVEWPRRADGAGARATAHGASV